MALFGKDKDRERDDRPRGAATTAAAAPAPVSEEVEMFGDQKPTRPEELGGTSAFLGKGTKIDKFHVEILGVVRKFNNGKDYILFRALDGPPVTRHLNIAHGMSGSPIYIDNKLMGAVAFAWSYGKEPIAGVTPFSQMHSYVEAFERRDLAEPTKPVRVGLKAPVRVGGRSYDAVTVSQSFDPPFGLARERQ